ncbi:MAG: methionine synthase [Mycobacteriales bacterium]
MTGSATTNVAPAVWRSGLATGIGSLPGEDPLEAARLVLGELPLPHLPELPGRGWYADLAGRGAALLADLHVDVQPAGWRLVPRPSRDGRRAKDLLAGDVDALELAAHDSPPEALKLQATGPWTLAALLELPRGDKVLADHGAVTDLAASLAEGLRAHLADVQRRFPSTALVLQLDEPALPAVLEGRVPTASGFGTLRAPDRQTVREHLRTVLAAAERTVVHCCAARPPIDLMREAGAVSIDAALPVDEDLLGEALEQGTGLLLGVVPGTDGPLPAVRAIVETVGRLRDRVGVKDVVLTPACGLAGASPDHARAVMQRLVQAAAEVGA